MTVTIVHPFVSGKADGVDTTVVRPTDWNDDHTIELSEPGVVGRSDAGAGAASVIPFSYFAVPTGAGFDFWDNVIPDGYLLAYGQAISRTTYAALFALFGTVYGSGDGTTTFNLPDKRGRVSIPRDAMGGTAANRVTAAVSGINGNSMGATGGSQSTTAAATGTITGTTSGSLSYSGTTGVNSSFTTINGAGSTNVAAHTHTHTYNGSTTGSLAVSGTFSGTTAAIVVMQPSIICNYIIKT
jgi:microcystin-dependent protein